MGFSIPIGLHMPSFSIGMNLDFTEAAPPVVDRLVKLFLEDCYSKLDPVVPMNRPIRSVWLATS